VTRIAYDAPYRRQRAAERAPVRGIVEPLLTTSFPLIAHALIRRHTRSPPPAPAPGSRMCDERQDERAL